MKRGLRVPIIAVFYGIVIRMYFQQSEHNPPHVHAFCDGYAAAIGIRDVSIMDGSLPQRASGLVRDWILVHQVELLDMWETQEFRRLAPLA